ncbi:uncharacterized protein LOC129600036 isoform X3 [Paramacrobiotus metropolitanus]|uniref:uncharacterized protein LOC129600036 isoform X3 n=1 Tax=Paramacrobiotus metropolitanus TaxID=2943436 RepID=UPI0024458A83|nr:uncharacterized protein LOC129600036 isoform X3 [Paramacrobiotus metropolitanus]
MNSWLLFLFAAAANGLKTTSTGSETDCSPQPIPLQNDQVAPGPPFPFRTDFLTEEECLVYGNHLQRNNPFWATRRCHDSSFNPRFFTYIPVKLSGSSDAVAATQKIRATSPTRAVTVTIDIGLIGADHSAEEALHTDVFEPIRQQVVQLFRKACNTPDAIHKIYNVGLLPSLIRLELKFCYNMTIKKRDFAHMPQLRIFEAIDSSIAEIEAHTFTDLVNLRSLMLERDISYHLSAYTDKTGPMSFYTIHNDADVERVRRLHCDCSYAWLRNFLKRKPYLLKGRSEGEVAIIGNFLTSGFGVAGEFRHYLNVDCSRPLTFANLPKVPVGTDAPFAYNTQCFDLSC